MSVVRLRDGLIVLAALAPLAGCGPSYSPDKYSPNAVQQANKVDRGEVIGVRKIGVEASGTVGTAAGAAAGGALGAQTPGGGIVSTLGAIGGGVVGGIVGNSAEHASGDTDAYEYIVRKQNNELVSVTQKDDTPLRIGAKVLVIAGPQARIVPDYTVDPNQPGSATAAAPVTPPAGGTAPTNAAPNETGSAAPSGPTPLATQLPSPLGTTSTSSGTSGGTSGSNAVSAITGAVPTPSSAAAAAAAAVLGPRTLPSLLTSPSIAAPSTATTP